MFLVSGEELGHLTTEYVVHNDAGNRDQQSDRRGFQRKAESDHDGIDGHGAGGTHRMECEHDTKHGAQQSNIRGVRGHRANDDQVFGQSHF